MRIRLLKANNGDAVVIFLPDENKQERIILIDGGVADTYMDEKGNKGRPLRGALHQFIEELKAAEKQIDLLILTHIDDDHIGGLLKWMNSDADAYKMIKEVWFNSGKLIDEQLGLKEPASLERFVFENTGKEIQTNIPQGKEFSEYINDHKIWNRALILQGQSIPRFGAVFNILSPSPEKLAILLKNWKDKGPDLGTRVTDNDYQKSLKDLVADNKYHGDTAYPNGSSIAFFITWQKQNFLFAADSHASVLVKGLKGFGHSATNPLPARVYKLSHHGSQANTSLQLLKCVNSRNYLISTNGAGSQHPHKRLLARVIAYDKGAQIYFNYPERIPLIFKVQDHEDFPNFKAIGLTADLDYTHD